ncbi:hypothetical protein AJ79_03608 [Helicocarpus griseus UAMH5409]|uniref:Uncharacterized protein n=1 Tax=Helicocarpus griseus UAMH5409 TaxID=1447875 RepID=A0A2B7XY38_9EURO|nr:hypothetical protein AJ79_03608 [Helicocarpus griseus UAMH5409]
MSTNPSASFQKGALPQTSSPKRPLEPSSLQPLHSPWRHTKYHIKSLGSGWISDHEGRMGSVFKSNFLCVRVRISTVPEHLRDRVDGVMRMFDGRLMEIQGVTCRVWLLEILKELVKGGFVRGGGEDAVGELERECKEIGNVHAEAAARNE